MKSELLLTLFILFLIDVSGADVEVSVMVGDSVTLHTNIKVETDNVIKWRFKQTRIAEIDEGHDEITAPDVEFKGRLQLDKQTGELKIRNIKTKDSGDYKLEIITTKETSEKTFSVIVVPGDAVKPVSLMVGDSVTFLTGLAEIQRGDLIMWMFGDTCIAEKHKGEEQFIVHKERFGDRLELVHQNGSLIITNTILADSGSYKLKINNSRYTIDRTITVTVTADVKSVSVMKGDFVTLHTGLTKIQIIQIQWKFGDILIADLNGPVNKEWSNIGVNLQNGDLNISNIQTNQSGDYKVEINTRIMTLHRKYHIPNLIDAVNSVSVKEGDSATLPTVIKIQNDDLIQWMFENIRLAEMHKATQELYAYSGPDERFRNRLELDYQTGSLIITNTRTSNSGDYELKISSSRYTINRRINVAVTGSDDRKDSDPDSGSCLSPGAAAGIAFAVILGAAAAVF